MILFFDTSALVKFFHREEGTEVVISLITDPGNTVWVSELARIEFVCALHRRYRMKEIDEDQLTRALDGFSTFAALGINLKIHPKNVTFFEAKSQPPPGTPFQKAPKSRPLMDWSFALLRIAPVHRKGQFGSRPPSNRLSNFRQASFKGVSFV
jgi:PIN domain